MTPVSYLLSVVTSHKDVQLTLAIMNIAGRGQAFHGHTYEDISTDVWIIPKGKKTRKEVLEQLRAIPHIQNVSIVALSNPVQNSELAEVRKLFTDIGRNSDEVSDNVLSLFINAKLERKYTHYIDYDHRKKLPVKIQIKPIEEHPHFSPDWLKPTVQTVDEIPDRDLTIDDIEIRSIVSKTVEKSEPPPPPPPTNQSV